MHQLYHINKATYQDSMRSLLKDSSQKYDKTCYISFNDPFNIVVRFLETIEGVDKEKFIIVDSSNRNYQQKNIDLKTYTIPIQDVFRTYLFLREVMANEQVDSLFIDSISALIHKFGDFPLRRMMTDLLLEISQYRCDTSLVVLDEHSDHEIIAGLRPFIAKTTKI